MKYGKRLTACTLAGLLGISVFSQPLTVYAKEWSRWAMYIRWWTEPPIHGVLARESIFGTILDWNQGGVYLM